MSKLVCLLILNVCVMFVEAEYASNCITPRGEAGKCMPISSCSNIESILLRATSQSTAISSEDISFIKNSACDKIDNVQHVCCANEYIQYNSKSMDLLSSISCGTGFTDRVAFGDNASLSSFPWMALLKYRNNGQDSFQCGGTLITDRYVLTAAHCVDGRSDVFEVRLGEHKISTEIDCVPAGKKKKCADPVEDIGIEKIIIHPEHQPNIIYNDIALLRLNRKVIIKKHIKPICLPTTEELRRNVETLDSFIVSGWGTTEKNHTSDLLLFASLINLDRTICYQAFNEEINESLICAKGKYLNASCKGDSGGPIQQHGNNKGRTSMIQYGIVGYGLNSCGRRSLPGIYTNVAYYMQWITDKLQDA